MQVLIKKGNSIKLITEEYTLADLEVMLKEYGKPVCEYLRATRKVYELAMAPAVSQDYPKHFEKFRETFLVLHRMIKLPWTLKV